MDACAARLQPLVEQYKPKQRQTYPIEKFRDLIVTTRLCPGYKKSLYLIYIRQGLQKIAFPVYIKFKQKSFVKMLIKNLILFRNCAQSKKYMVSQKLCSRCIECCKQFLYYNHFFSFIRDTLIVKIEGKFSLMATKT